MQELKGVTVTGFEGPEKRLEINFKVNPSNPLGLRNISKDQWQEMLNFSKCLIISEKKNDFFDSYVLSESSLFVFPFKLMIKTCGTTTLLLIIPKLLEYAILCDLEVEYVVYSRKNFLFPEAQVYPHTDWNYEVDLLENNFSGKSYVLGPLSSDHWYLYVADYSTPAIDPEMETAGDSRNITLEIMMHNLERSAAFQFYRKEGTDDRDKFPGVAELIPGSETDEFNFTPCGYSMNGLLDTVYYTIHVTPEPQCSYASFETNLSVLVYKKLIRRVFDMFKPGTVTLTLREKSGKDISMDMDIPGYSVKYRTVSEVGDDHTVVLCNYQANDFSTKKRASALLN